jgi:pyrimidine deaminase RibD-like protein
VSSETRDAELIDNASSATLTPRHTFTHIAKYSTLQPQLSHLNHTAMPLEHFPPGLAAIPAQLPINPKDHDTYMRLALDQAQESPPKPSNYRVGALLVDADTGAILERGYTLELEGNTHAEQCCLSKFALAHDLPEDRVGEALPPNAVIYTTMEPCNLRLSGNLPCADRIIRTRGKDGKPALHKVYIGVKEPEKFVGENEGRKKLEENGIEVVHVPGFEEDILRIATAGHEK